MPPLGIPVSRAPVEREQLRGERSANMTRNTAPASGALTADTCPLCACTMVRAMESPMPIPSALVVKNGSNTSFSLSAGMRKLSLYENAIHV